MTILSSGEITKTSLVNQSWSNVYNLINDNLSDPTGSVNRKWIYSREPSMKSMDEEGYPIVIIWPLKLTQSNQSLNMVTRDLMWECEIEIRSTDRDKDGREYLSLVTDSLFDLFNDTTNKRLLLTYGMQMVNLNMEGNDYIDVAQEGIYLSRFTLSFRYRMDTS